GAAGLANVITRVADVQTDALPSRHFHRAVSRFGVMFFDDLRAAFANIRSSLRARGRLAFVCWQPVAANDVGSLVLKAIEPVTGPPGPLVRGPGPYALSDEGLVRSVLADAGYTDVELRPFEAPVVMGGGEGLDAAVAHCAWMGEVRRVLAGAGGEGRPQAIAPLRGALADPPPDGPRRPPPSGAVWPG